jgi:hypothetical protein
VDLLATRVVRRGDETGRRVDLEFEGWAYFRRYGRRPRGRDISVLFEERVKELGSEFVDEMTISSDRDENGSNCAGVLEYNGLTMRLTAEPDSY